MRLELLLRVRTTVLPSGLLAAAASARASSCSLRSRHWAKGGLWPSRRATCPTIAQTSHASSLGQMVERLTAAWPAVRRKAFCSPPRPAHAPRTSHSALAESAAGGRTHASMRFVVASQSLTRSAKGTMSVAWRGSPCAERIHAS